jgi:hypothetical protein
MKKNNLLLVISILANPLMMMAGPGVVPAEALDKLKTQSKQSKVMDIAFHLTDVSGPRLTVSPGFTRAANWAVKELTDFGLQNARLEPWGEFGKGWEQQKTYVAITAPYYSPLTAIPRAWSGSTGKKPIEGEVILAEAADSAAFIAKYHEKLKGKIVLLAYSDTLKPSFESDGKRFTDAELEKMAAVEAKKGKGFSPDSAMRVRIKRYLATRKINELITLEQPGLILVYGRGNNGTLFAQGANGTAYKTDSPEQPASVAITADDYLKIQRLIRAGIPVKIEAEVKTRFYTDDTKGYNVVAEIPGTDPALKDEVVMLGGHLDSWHAATGATDNAAGCAVMIEAIRLIKASGLQPKRTIRIALWSGEEEGLFGSEGWVKNNLADPTQMVLKPEHEKVSAYFNLDNGSGRIRGIYAQGNTAVKPIFQEWLNSFGDSTAKTVTLDNTGGTDHLSFDAVGVPGFQFIQDPLEYDTRTHHSNMDDFDHLVPEDLIQASAVAAWFVYNTAQRDEKLPRKELPKAKKAAPMF